MSPASGKWYTNLTNNNLSNPDRINLNVLTEKTSLNSPERTGVYYVTGNNIGALPSGFSNYGILLCMRSPYSLHPTNSNCVYVQEYTDVYGKHASRSSNNGVWTNWVTTATKNDFVIKTYTIAGKAVNAETTADFEPNIVLSGYTPLGIVGTRLNAYGSVTLVYADLVDDTKARVRVRNNGTESVTGDNVIIRVLYFKS